MTKLTPREDFALTPAATIEADILQGRIDAGLIPATVNGYRIIGAEMTPGGRGTRAGHVILVDRGADRTFHRYVTAWLGQGDEGWDQGHYITDLAEARVDFRARSRRGY